MSRRTLALLLAGVLWPAATASAATTIGSTLAGATPSGSCGAATFFDTALGAGTVAVPYDGVLVRWRMSLPAPGGSYTYKLRALQPMGGDTYKGAGTSAAQTAPNAGVNTLTLATPLAVKAGDVLGVDCPNGAPAPSGFSVAGSSMGYFANFLADGATATPDNVLAGEENFLNADLVGVPAVAALAASSGTPAGGTGVVITGTHLGDVSAVSFGTTPATAVSVQSDGQITATSPAHAAGPVDVTVTDAAGTSATLAADQFTFVAPPPAPTPAPAPVPLSCAMKPSATVRVRQPRHGRHVALGRLSVSVSCNQSATVTVSGSIAEKHHTYRLAAVLAHAPQTVALVLAAHALADLRRGVRESASLTLSTGATARVARLRGI